MREVPANTAHAEDTEDLIFGVVAKGWRGVAAPLMGAEGEEGGVEVSEGAEEEEEGCVCCGGVDGGGDVGDVDLMVRAGGDVDSVS